MKKLYFKYGVMGSSKSAQALMTAFNYRQKGIKVLLLKSCIDTRDNTSSPMITSTIGLSSQCITFSQDENLLLLVEKYPTCQVIVVDEAQFCSKQQIDQLKELTIKNKVVLCYGLKTNFKGELFEGSKRLLEIAESIQEIKSTCRCGEKSTMNARIIDGYVVTQGQEIQIGGDESYEGMCYECYKKYQTTPIEKLQKITENENLNETNIEDELSM